MTRLFITLPSIVLALLAPGAIAAPASVADALFAEQSTEALSPRDRTEVAAVLPMTLQRGVLVSTFAGCEGRPMGASVSLADLNRDGTPEVLVHAGNACTSGMTGATLWLIARGADARWRAILNVPAIDFRVMPSRVQGWNELALAGRAECLGVWQHDRDRFVFSRKITPDGRPCRP